MTVATLNWNDFETIRVYDAATGRLERECGKDMLGSQMSPDGSTVLVGTDVPASKTPVWRLRRDNR